MVMRLVKTSVACPEQYDAYDGDEQVGYLRLRHGHFTVRCPNVEGEIVFAGWPNGDGVFDPTERDDFLTFAVKAIERWRMVGRPPEEAGHELLAAVQSDVKYVIEDYDPRHDR